PPSDAMSEKNPLQRESEVILQLRAGLDPQGVPVLEQVEAWTLSCPGLYELMKTPLFLRNLAAGDVFRTVEVPPGGYRVVARGGRLAIRVFRREGLDALEEELTPEVEKLGGSLDRRSDRGLAYSLHVNVGFAAVEELFDRVMGRFPDSVWYYGN